MAELHDRSRSPRSGGASVPAAASTTDASTRSAASSAGAQSAASTTDASTFSAPSAGAPRVRLGGHTYLLEESAKVGELRDSTGSRADPEELRRRLAEDGYLFLRGVLPAEAVRGASTAVLQQLNKQGLLKEGSPWEDGVCGGSTGSNQGKLRDCDEVICGAAFKGAAEHPALFELLRELFEEKARTFDFKWLRAVRPGESTGYHMDSVYMARGSPRLITCWFPLMDVSRELGGLALVPGSHRLESFARVRETYGKLDLDRDDVGGTGWFSEDPEEVLRFGRRFETADFRAGDVVLFGLHTLHGSAVNCTDRWRLSVDVRFQPSSEPIDPRWVRDPASRKIEGVTSRWELHRDDPKEFPRTMEDAKKAWGLASCVA